MARATAPTQADFRHTWFVREWMAMHGKIQADLLKDLGWSKAKAHAVWHGQQYTQALIDELAPWLNAQPYEMLLSPDDAMAIRGMRKDAIRIASSKVLGEAKIPDSPVRQKRA